MPEPGQPEGYNRYAYANGNPLLFSDPSGHIAICFQGGTGEEVDLEGAIVAMCDAALARGGYDPLQDGDVLRLPSRGNDFDKLVDRVKAAVLANEPVVVLGHSWGGIEALNFVERLDNNIENRSLSNPFGDSHPIPVDLLILFDAEGVLRPSSNKNAGDNVKMAYNYYAENADDNKILSELLWYDGLNNVEGATNILIEGSTHYSILDINDQRRFGSEEQYRDGESLKVNPVTLEFTSNAVFESLKPFRLQGGR